VRCQLCGHNVFGYKRPEIVRKLKAKVFLKKYFIVGRVNYYYLRFDKIGLQIFH
jgi:uncharacterized membrane protein YGL010W